MTPLFDDRHAEVRAQAAVWAADRSEPASIMGLLGLLADAEPLCRFSAQDALLRCGPPAVDPLAQKLATSHGVGLEAALEVAIGLADPCLLPAALALCREGQPRARALAAALAGSLGGAEAVSVLVGMLDDTDPGARAAAARSLSRLGQWQTAPAVALLLGDRHWMVRREAGEALRNLGGPGILLLRRALGDPDPFAQDMARHVLDVIEATAMTQAA